MTEDSELLAVLVALEPLDDRKWEYLDLARRRFDAEAMLEEPWSSGERVLIEVAASLWNTGKVDLGYIACALGGQHLQAVIDATAIRAGHDLKSNADVAVRRIGSDQPRSHDQERRHERNPSLDRHPDHPVPDRSRGLEL